MAAKPGGTRSRRSQRTGTAEEPRTEPPLSLDRIVATAVELLDTEGVDGLTMRRLADRVGAGAMSLYWHVDNKEAVFDLALDAVLEYRGPPQPAESEDWRGDILHLLEDWRASMLRHPWSASLLPRRALGPNILARLELLGKTLSGRPRSERRHMVAVELCDGRYRHPKQLPALGRRQGRRAAASYCARTLPDNRTRPPAAGRRLGRHVPKGPRPLARGADLLYSSRSTSNVTVSALRIRTGQYS